MKRFKLRTDLRIALLYALFGALWILLSDYLLAVLVRDASSRSELQTYKGWAFVIASALMIFLLLRRELALRHRMEEKYDASEERFHQLFEHSLDAVLLTTPDGSILSANPAACIMFGRTEAEICRIGRNGLVVTDSRLQQALEQRARTGSFHGGLTFQRADGTTFEGEVTTTLYQTKDGMTRTSMIIRDITEQKQAEEALRESEERFFSAFEYAAIGMALVAVDGRWLRVNRQLCHLVGYSAAELSSITFKDITHPDDLETDLAYVQQMLAGEIETYHMEKRYIHKQGRVVWVLLSVSLVRDSRGEPLYFISQIQDITERKKLEENLHSAELQYRTLVEQVPPIIYMTGLDQYIGVTYVSPRINALGFTQAEWVADPELWVRQLHPDDRERVLEQIDEIKKSGIVPKMEYRLMTHAGEVRWFLDEVMNVRDADGKLVYRQGIMLDITDRKQAEQELRLSRDRLAELSRQLARVQETERRAIGRELHDQIGQMLTAIKINLDLLPDLPPERAAQKMTRAQEIAAELLNRVSRLSLELRPPMLDDLGLIPALVWQIRHYQEQSGPRVDFHHSGVEGIRFDPEIESTVYRVVQEALTNVVRHAKATRVRLEVQARGAQIEVQLEDDGQGFDPKTALAKNRGLSGMWERVTLLNGSFQIESEPGHGTRIAFRLPLQESSHD